MRVLVLMARGLHAGYVGCYGNEWVATPTLDGLAAEGIVFDQHFADRPDRTGAHHAWQTGRYSFPVPDVNSETDPTPDAFSLLRDRGVVTFLISDEPAPYLTGSPGWQYVWQPEPRSGKISVQEQVVETVRQALDRLRALDRWLLRVDLDTLGPPWVVPDEIQELYREEDLESGEGEPLPRLIRPDSQDRDPEWDVALRRVRARYAAAVTYLDHGLAAVVQELANRGILDNILLLVTADRGQGLGERGDAATAYPSLHEEFVHVPLIVRMPGKAEAGLRVAALTQSVDLVPTLLEAFALPTADLHGRSLLPLIRSEIDRVRPYACSGLHAGDAIDWALRTPQWSLLLPVRSPADQLPRQPQLYVKPDDRWEVNNLYQQYLDLAEGLEATLRAFVQATRRPGAFQPPDLAETAICE
jgi:arylsulfatase A-like enzyme